MSIQQDSGQQNEAVLEYFMAIKLAQPYSVEYNALKYRLGPKFGGLSIIHISTCVRFFKIFALVFPATPIFGWQIQKVALLVPSTDEEKSMPSI